MMTEFGVECWHLRLHVLWDMEDVITLIERIANIYIISQEIGHYHVFIKTSMLEKQIRSIIKEDKDIKGNRSYSLAVAKEERQLMKYVLKDGKYVFKGIPEEEIELLQKCSYKKGKKSFAKDLDLLEEKFYNNKIGNLLFIEELLQLKVSYGQNIYDNQIINYVKKCHMKKDGNYLEQYSNYLIDSCHGLDKKKTRQN